MTPQNADTQATQLEREAASHGGPGPEKTSSIGFQAAEIRDFAAMRGRVENEIRDLAARFYRNIAETETEVSIALIELIGPYCRAFRPTDREVAELLKDSNPRHAVPPRTTLVVETGHEPVDKRALLGQKPAKPSSSYKQYAGIWRDASDIQYGYFERKKWEKVTPEAIQYLATAGASVDGELYHSPIDALKNGCTLRKTVQAFKEVLTPNTLDMDVQVTDDQHSAAMEYARDLKVVVKLWNEDMERSAPKAVKIAHHPVCITGAIVGILDEAKKNNVTLAPEQIGLIMGALEQLESKN